MTSKVFAEKKNHEQNENQHGDQVNWSCYGKQKLRKTSKDGSYAGLCDHECRFKRQCISASREGQLFQERQLMQVQLDGERTSEDNYDSEGKLRSAVQKVIINRRGANDVSFIIKGLGVKEDFEHEFMEAFRRVVYLYFMAPAIFDFMVRSIYKGESQSEHAKMIGITKQAFSKGLVREACRMQTPDKLPEELEGLEKAVYALVLEGFSIRDIAEMLKISKDKVFRVRQIVASKNADFATVKISRRKKTRKKRRTKNQIFRDNQKSIKQQLEQLKRLKKELAKKI